MLSIAGIFFLSMLIINVNRGTGDRITELASNESVIQATALAEGMFEEIQSRAFDEKTVDKPIHQANLLTPANKMKKDFGEVSSTSFDDIDDYNNYTRHFSSGGMGNFVTRVNVYYVEEASPEEESIKRTFLKCVRISVNNQYLPTELIFNRLVSY